MTLVKLDKKTLFAEFALDDLSEPEKDQVFALLTEIFNLRLLDSILERLSQEDQEIFLKTLHLDEEKARLLLSERVENLDTLISEVTQQVKKDFSQDVKMARNKK